jgi:hypothetical protein
MAKEYVFVDAWEVDAPHEAVFRALVDARTYPEWWKPVFKGRLPYTLWTTSEIVTYNPPT